MFHIVIKVWCSAFQAALRRPEETWWRKPLFSAALQEGNDSICCARCSLRCRQVNLQHQIASEAHNNTEACKGIIIPIVEMRRLRSGVINKLAMVLQLVSPYVNLGIVLTSFYGSVHPMEG